MSLHSSISVSLLSSFICIYFCFQRTDPVFMKRSSLVFYLSMLCVCLFVRFFFFVLWSLFLRMYVLLVAFLLFGCSFVCLFIVLLLWITVTDTPAAVLVTFGAAACFLRENGCLESQSFKHGPFLLPKKASKGKRHSKGDSEHARFFRARLGSAGLSSDLIFVGFGGRYPCLIFFGCERTPARNTGIGSTQCETPPIFVLKRC